MDSATLNFCLGQGVLVAATGEISDDRHDYVFPSRENVGCNSLRCLKCGAAVRFIAGIDWSTQPVNVDDVLTAPDPRVLPSFTAGSGRLYRCECTAHVERDVSPIDKYLEEGTSSVGQKWRCAGHAVLTLPAMVHGIAVDGAQPAVVRTWVQALAHSDANPWVARYALVDFFFRLRGTAIEPLLTMAIAALVSSDDRHERDVAVGFYATAPAVMGAERVGLWLAEKPEWFGGEIDLPIKSRYTAALATATRAVSAGRPYEPPVQELVRREALTAEHASTLLAFVEQHDTDWFLANAHRFPVALHGKIKRDLYYLATGEIRRAIEAKLAGGA